MKKLGKKCRRNRIIFFVVMLILFIPGASALADMAIFHLSPLATPVFLFTFLPLLFIAIIAGLPFALNSQVEFSARNLDAIVDTLAGAKVTVINFGQDDAEKGKLTFCYNGTDYIIRGLDVQMSYDIGRNSAETNRISFARHDNQIWVVEGYSERT